MKEALSYQITEINKFKSLPSEHLFTLHCPDFCMFDSAHYQH